MQNIVEFIEQLGNLEELSGTSSLSNYSDYLNENFAIELINLALNNEVYFDYIRDNSFVHDLGVVKIILLKNINYDRDLRIHIWNNNGENCPTRIDKHDHKWSFISRILTGEFIHTIYDNEESHSMHSRKYSFEKSSQNHTNSIVCTKNIDIEKLTSTRLLPKTIYYMNDKTIHTLHVVSKLGMTLMLRFRYNKEKTIVYTKRQIALNKQQNSPKKITKIKLKEILLQAKYELSNTLS